MALDCVDDPMAVLGERIVEVPRLWSDVLGLVAGAARRDTGAGDPDLVVVGARRPGGRCRPSGGIRRGGAADGRRSCARMTHATVVELSAEFVVIAPPDSEVRWCCPATGATSRRHLGAATSVLVDVPTGVAPFPARRDRAAACRRHSRQAQRPAPDGARAAIATLPQPAAGHVRRGAMAAIGEPCCSRGALLSAAAGRRVAYPGGDGQPGRPVDGSAGRGPRRDPGARAVDGRADHRRVPDRPGCGCRHPPATRPRLHLTQSTGAAPTSIADVAESLRRALESEHRRGVRRLRSRRQRGRHDPR